MADDFAYDQASNLLTCCNGTSEAPKDMTDLSVYEYTTPATLLDGATPAADLELTYQIRPAEHRALTLSIVLDGCTLENDETVLLTGKNSEGWAQTETVAIDSGNSTYTTAKTWRSIDTNGIDCVGFDDGTITITQPRQGVLAIYHDYRFYEVMVPIRFGDDSTSSYFRIYEANVYFRNTVNIRLYGALCLGHPENDWPRYISSVHIPTSASGTYFLTNGTFLSYGANISLGNTLGDGVYLNFRRGTVELHRTNIDGDASIITFDRLLTKFQYNDLLVLESALRVNKQPNAASDKLHLGYGSKLVVGWTSMNIRGLEVTDAHTPYVETTEEYETTTILDPKEIIDDCKAVVEEASITQKFMCNLHVVDEDGNNLSGVTVKLYDYYNSQYNLAWSNGLTGADGRLTAAKYVRHSYWNSDDGAPTGTYYPHKFEFTKAGYVGLTLENVQINEPMVPDWRIEMSLSNSDLVSAVETALGNKQVDTAAKVLVNKAVQNKSTGAIDYYNDVGAAVVLTHTPSDDGTDITRTPS